MDYKTLPLLDVLFLKYRDVDLSQVVILSCQHILDTNIVTLSYLLKLGLKPENIFVLGKAYSSSKASAEELAILGIVVHRHSFSFDSHVDWDSQFENYIEEFYNESIAKISLKKAELILVIDDGGRLIMHANKHGYGLPMQCIEWTSSGHNALSDVELNLPVLNMARSRAKLEIESVIIGSEIVRKIDYLHKQFLETKKKCLVIGRGAIGRAVYNALVPTGKEVQIIDIETSINSVPLDEIDMVIGCTGKHSFCTESTKSAQDQLLLVSASSSDREFEAVRTRIHYAQNNDTHKDYAYQNAVLVNSGFPINFDGQSVFTPVEKMQVTLALVFASTCYLATRTLPAGIQPFPKEEDDFICAFFKS